MDLRDLPTFTIDPPDARDFDDAISAQREGDRVRLWVHIADVTAYVRPGTAVDAEAVRRGTSVYVPGAVEPMLPEELSNQACSLRPGEDRLAVTVELEISGTDVLSQRFLRSLIRSDARLTYPQVDAVFEGRDRAEEPWGEPLAAAREVAGALRARRDERGSLAVNSSEPVFDFDSDGHVTGVRHEPQTESHRVIEELMVLANERVAGHLADSAHAHALPGARAPGPAVGGVHGRAARLPGRAHPAGARAHEPPAGGRPGRRGLAPGGRRTWSAPAAAGRRSARWCCARSSRPSTRRATWATPGWPARATATSPRRSAGSPTSRSTARCWPSLGLDDAAPRGARARGGGRRELGPRARGDDHRARRRRRLPRLPARAGAVRAGARGEPSRARWSA